MRILVVEDDRAMGKLLRAVLTDDGYAVDVASDGEQGRMLALVHSYDGIVLDLDLGARSGLEILHELRGAGRTTPVLILTGREDSPMVVAALDAGADEYAVKPINNEEIRARVRALVRRGETSRSSEQLAYGNVSMNRLTRRVRVGNSELVLTPREQALLEHLMLSPDRVVSRTELLEKVWDMHFDPGSNVIDVHMRRLRRKLEAAQSNAKIASRRGFGFVLTTAVES